MISLHAATINYFQNTLMFIS